MACSPHTKLSDTVRSGLENSQLDRFLWRAILIVALLLFVTLAAIGFAYYRSRYVHNTLSVVDREITAIENEIRQRPADAELRVTLAELYLEKARFDAAISQAEQVVRIKPTHLRALTALARARAEKGEIDKAIDLLAYAIESNKDSPMSKASRLLPLAEQYLGSLYLRQARAEEAEKVLRSSAASDMANADTLHLLGKALAMQGKLDEAIEAYRAALRLVPDFPDVWGDLARAYEEKGDRDGDRLAWGMISYITGQYDEALANLQEAAKALPDMVEVHLGLAMIYEKTGERQRALEEYQAALKADQRSFAAQQGIARLSKQLPAGGEGNE